MFKAKSRARTMRREKAMLVDGCATFFRRDRFVLEATEDLEVECKAFDVFVRLTSSLFSLARWLWLSLLFARMRRPSRG